jgi:hypothetical protein
MSSATPSTPSTTSVVFEEAIYLAAENNKIHAVAMCGIQTIFTQLLYVTVAGGGWQSGRRHGLSALQAEQLVALPPQLWQCAE